MLDRLDPAAVLFEPKGRSRVQNLQPVRVRIAKPPFEKPCEESVVTIPTTLLVEREDECIARLQ